MVLPFFVIVMMTIFMIVMVMSMLWDAAVVSKVFVSGVSVVNIFVIFLFEGKVLSFIVYAWIESIRKELLMLTHFDRSITWPFLWYLEVKLNSSIFLS